ncbi:MAG: DeoR/GlpR family DNA-binding transcription regulator [Pleomorphochaeta sp.]|jgi:DeoR/GlpR family transcriptional regulator of sugar metabolism
MLAKERRDQIKSILDSEKTVTVKKLAQDLNVTMETIRSDLEYLSKKNVGIIKVHGGAYKIDTFDKTIPIKLREQVMVKEKQYLGKMASSFIQDGDILMLDSSSTSFCIAKELNANKIKATVITNSLSIINILSNSHLIKLICLGGNLIDKSNAFCGTITINNLKKLHADKAFLSPTSISKKFGLSHDDEFAAQISKKMIDNSDNVFLVVDHTKFGKSSLTKIEDFEKINCVISNKKPDKSWIDFFKENKIILKTYN